MILVKGNWSGKGRVLVEGASVGEVVQVDLNVLEDPDGMTITGDLGGGFKGNVSIRIAANDVGTYVIDAHMGGVALDGIAKLESEPNLALMWNEAGTQSASVSLFPAGGGVGCRGFWREGGHTRTWEILFKPEARAFGGGNVVSLRRR